MENGEFVFLALDQLSDNELELLIKEKIPANISKGYVPMYIFDICLTDTKQKIGSISIRIGNNENLYYGGHIGYEIDEAFRGHGYAAKACKLIRQIAEVHGLEPVTITCNPTNHASRRTCEKIGAELLEIVKLPPHNDLYLRGEREACRYEWKMEKTS